MYFPYLRGKQFELMALRDMSSFLALNNEKVSPIIEPVKFSTTFDITLRKLKESNVNFTIVLNPEYGDAQDKYEQIMELVTTELGDYSNFQIGLIINDNYFLKASEIKGCLVTTGPVGSGLSLIHNSVLDADNIKSLQDDLSSIAKIKYNVINFDKTNSNRRYYREFIESSRVSLADYFESQNRNSDYKDKSSAFTEEHLFYKTEQFVGFGDFATIGDNYSEAGFMPFAVAIHISYKDTSGKVMVRHFVSDSNGDRSDVAGKFNEANSKLVEWSKNTGIETQGIKEFIDLYNTGHFPGLGSIKKLAIMNHIELMVSLV
ncbi:MAG: sce7725 family protein [Candidatus Altimarinota bacterium]